MKEIKGKPKLAKGYLLVYLSGECFVCIRCSSDNKLRDIKIYLKQFLEDISCRNAIDLNHQLIRKELKDALKLAKIEQSQEEEIFSNYLVYCKGSIFGSDLDLVQTNEQLDIYDGKKICCSIQLYKKLTWVSVAILLVTILLVGLLLIFLSNNGDGLHDEYHRLTIPPKQSDELEEMSIENVEGPVDTIAHLQQPIIPDNFILIPSGILKQYKGKERQMDSFFISKYEMTQLDWKKFFPEDSIFYYSINNEYPPNKLKILNDSLPVERNFYQIIQYCIKRSKIEGYDGFYRIEDGKCLFDSNGNGYRLPCEAEWIFAARACSKRRRYISGDKLQEIAWYGGNSKYRPHPVGLMKPNELGIYDMCGNVTELCWPEERFKISQYPGVHIGGNYLSYIQITEDDVYLVGHESEIGFRLVFIPKGTKNDNIINLNTSYKAKNGTKEVVKDLTQQERFNQAKRKSDWNSIKKLADEGYSSAFMPLAKHYISNPKNHGLAKKYALKAKRAGIPGTDELLKKLEDLDY